ncbi:MAG: hypothetical protein ACKO6N_27425 [Myxococcota bacterium]
MYSNQHHASVAQPPHESRSNMRAFNVSALVPPEGHAIFSFDGAVSGPPMLTAVNAERREAFTLVAAFECGDRKWLAHQQVGMQAAEYNEQQQLMLYCLLSPKNAALLLKRAELHFLAVPSLGAKIMATEEPQPDTRYPLWAFYVPDTTVTRARLRVWYDDHPSEDGSTVLQ